MTARSLAGASPAREESAGPRQTDPALGSNAPAAIAVLDGSATVLCSSGECLEAWRAEVRRFAESGRAAALVDLARPGAARRESPLRLALTRLHGHDGDTRILLVATGVAAAAGPPAAGPGRDLLDDYRARAATDVAHELSQPLNVIRMAAQNALVELGLQDSALDQAGPATALPPLDTDPRQLQAFLVAKLQRIISQVDRAAEAIARLRATR